MGETDLSSAKCVILDRLAARTTTRPAPASGFVQPSRSSTPSSPTASLEKASMEILLVHQAGIFGAPNGTRRTGRRRSPRRVTHLHRLAPTAYLLIYTETMWRANSIMTVRK